MLQSFSTFRAKEHRTFLKIWLVYVALLALLYAVLPVTFERNWLEFFTPVQNGYLPYVDFHVGYPPVGFLPYLLLALLSNFEVMTFAALMRIFDAFFLALSVWLIYIIVFKVRGKRDAFLSAFVVMLSFSTLTYSRHANEPIALFFALLGVYFLLDKKALHGGVAIGLGAMTKILPGLLIIPALKRLKLTSQRILLIGAAYAVVLFVNLPFMVFSPFMWFGTYSYNGARGPWETVWALIDGWYSHGGAEALHPYFEVFIPYSQLNSIYQPSPYDHAFYAWNNPWLSTLLTVFGTASLLLAYLLVNERDLLEGSALTLFLFIFFSKGYSPQFTILMLPFISMAFVGIKKIGLCLMLEIGTILQSIVWTTNLYSVSLLVFSTSIRAAAFAFVIAFLILHFMKDHRTVSLQSIRLPRIKNFKDKSTVVFLISIIMVSGSAYYLIDHYRRFPQTIKTQEGAADLTLYEAFDMLLPNLTRNQRVMFNLTSTSPINVTLAEDDEEIWTIGTPKYTVKDLFIPHDSGNYSLSVNMTYPTSHFKIIDGTERDGLGKIEQTGNALNITLTDFGQDDINSVLKLSWTVDFAVTLDFRVKMMTWQFGNHANRTSLTLSTASDTFEYEIPSSDQWHWFEMNSSSITSDGKTFSYVRDKRIETIGLALNVDDGTKSGVGITGLEIENGERAERLDLSIENTSEVSYKIYFVQMYSLPNSAMLYVSYITLVFGTNAIWMSLYKRFKKIDD